MNTIYDLLTACENAGIRLHVAGGRLQYRVRSGGMPADLRARLMANRSALITHLSTPRQAEAQRPKRVVLGPVTRRPRTCQGCGIAVTPDGLLPGNWSVHARPGGGDLFFTCSPACRARLAVPERKAGFARIDPVLESPRVGESHG